MCTPSKLCNVPMAPVSKVRTGCNVGKRVVECQLPQLRKGRLVTHFSGRISNVRIKEYQDAAIVLHKLRHMLSGISLTVDKREYQRNALHRLRSDLVSKLRGGKFQVE